MENLKGQYIDKRLARERQVLERAIDDKAFRAQLLKDPKGTLSATYGVTIPADGDVRVFEETLKSHYVVLPPYFGADGEELSDEMLEAVAGGWFVSLTWTIICFGDGSPGKTSPPVVVPA